MEAGQESWVGLATLRATGMWVFGDEARGNFGQA